MFTEQNRQDPDWTRERWDQAMRELAAYHAKKQKSPLQTVGEMNLFGAGLEILDQQNGPSAVDFEAEVAEKTGRSRGEKLRIVKANESSPEFARDEQQQAQAQQAKNRSIQKQNQQRLEFAKLELEKDRRFAAHPICEQLLTHSPSLLEEAIRVLREEDVGFESVYQFCKSSGKSPLEQYQSSPLLYPLIDTHLEQQYPEHFQGVRDTYDSRLHEMTDRLAA